MTHELKFRLLARTCFSVRAAMSFISETEEKVAIAASVSLITERCQLPHCTCATLNGDDDKEKGQHSH